MAGPIEEHRDRRLTDLTELRTHGVSGTPPEVMLRTDQLEVVAGDGLAGFYRRHDGGGDWTGTACDAEEGDARSRDLEAYSWGGLTSKSWSRALWAALIPFTLSNMAGWLLDASLLKRAEDRQDQIDGKRPRLRLTAIRTMLRLMAMSITVIITVWFGALTVDVLAYQCGGQEACYSDHFWMSFFDWDIFSDHPIRRVALGYVAAALLPIGLWALGRRSLGRYEDHGPEADTRGVAGGADPALVAGIADRRFWYSQSLVRYLQRLNLAVAIAALTVVTSWGVAKYGDDRNLSVGWAWGTMLYGVGAIALIVVLVMVAKPRRHLWAGVMLWLVLAGGAAFVVLATLTGFSEEFPTLATVGVPGALSVVGPGALEAALTGLDGYRQAAVVMAVFFGTGAFVLAVGFTTAWKVLFTVRRRGAALWGLGPTYANSLAILISSAVMAALVSKTANWMGTRFDPADLRALVEDAATDLDVLRLQGKSLIYYSPGYDYYAVAFSVFLLFLVVSFVSWFFYGKLSNRRWGRRSDNMVRLAARYAAAQPCQRIGDVKDWLLNHTLPTGTGTEERERHENKWQWLNSIRGTRNVEDRIDRADGPLRFVFTAVLLPGVLVMAIWAWGLFFGDWFDEDLPIVLPSLLVTTAGWIALAVPLALVWYARQAMGDSNARRRLGIIWDVTTYFPRWFHPLAPPTYATRAVPDVQSRLYRLVGADDDPPAERDVVISVHSQGCMIVYAALQRMLTEATRTESTHTRRSTAATVINHTGLLTYGNPLNRFYVKFFPAYFDEAGCDLLRGALTSAPAEGVERRTRWRNITRVSDPLGKAVYGEDDSGAPLKPAGGRDERGQWIDVAWHDPRIPAGYEPPAWSKDDLYDDWVAANPGWEPPDAPWPAPGDPLPQSKGHSDYYTDVDLPAYCRLVAAIDPGAAG